MRGEDITMFCGEGGQCILGEWDDMNAYRKDFAKLKQQIKNSPLANPQTRRPKKKQGK